MHKIQDNLLIFIATLFVSAALDTKAHEKVKLR